MPLGHKPVGTQPRGTIEDITGFIETNPFRLLTSDPDAELIYTLESDPLRRRLGAGTFPYPMGDEPRGGIKPSDSAIQMPFYASTKKGGFRTGPTDSPANADFKGRLVTPLDFETSLPLPGSSSASARLSFGRIVLQNRDGELDDLVAAAWGGRTVTIRVGGTFDVGRVTERTLKIAEFGVYFRGTVASIENDRDTGYLTLTVRDPFERLNVELQTNLYAGTGGLEGGDQVKGVPKPLAFGRCLNIPGILLDPAKLIYQLHDGPIQGGPGVAGGFPNGVPIVRDQGAVLTFDSDVPDIEATVTPVGGSFKTQMTGSGAYVRLGAEPTGQITADVDGDNVGGFVNGAATIARRLATTYGGILDPSELDAKSFAAFPDRGVCGFYRGPDPTTVEDALDQVLFESDGYVTFTRDGRLRVGAFVTPEASMPIATIDATDVHVGKVSEAQIPAWRVRVGYARNWVTQDADGLAAILTADEREGFAQEFKFESSQALSVKDHHRNAREITRHTIMHDVTKVQTLNFTMLDRERRRRILAEILRSRSLFQHEVGDVIATDQLPSGVRSGQYWIARMKENPLERELVLELWGEPGWLPAFTLGATPLGQSVI